MAAEEYKVLMMEEEECHQLNAEIPEKWAISWEEAAQAYQAGDEDGVLGGKTLADVFRAITVGERSIIDEQSRHQLFGAAHMCTINIVKASF